VASLAAKRVSASATSAETVIKSIRSLLTLCRPLLTLINVAGLAAKRVGAAATSGEAVGGAAALAESAQRPPRTNSGVERLFRGPNCDLFCVPQVCPKKKFILVVFTID
jgi:hypothetical protein